jgi:crotonobetainyl-CoA:carnitine CoA-transferase CaiB-like acyl-CoA transferase
LSGAYAFGAIQAALLHRERTGEGQVVDVALMDSMLNLLVFECQEAQFPSQRPRPVYVPMKSTDGHVIIAPISQKNFEQMAEAMQQLELTADARFATGSARVEHWNELMAVMEQWTRRHSSTEIESIMDANGVPCSRFVTVADAMRDTQLTERGSLSRVKDAAGEFIVPNAPFQFTIPTAAGPTVAALGADNTNVLSDILGMSPLEIDALQEQGVLSNQ